MTGIINRLTDWLRGKNERLNKELLALARKEANGEDRSIGGLSKLLRPPTSRQHKQMK